MVTLVDVASRVEVVTPGSWQAERVPGIPENTNTVIVNVDEFGDEIFLDSSGFDTPSRLLYGTAGGELEEIKRAPSFFDAADLEVTQHFANSDDGTAIPYFVVRHRHVQAPGPTLLGRYGGVRLCGCRLWPAGGRWVPECGARDNPGGGDFSSKSSPYHNISADRKHPPVLITTSTRDDRVHPGHARKMTAALEAAGHPVQYYENIEGGHAAAADNAQTAFRAPLIFEFLHRTLDDH